MEYDIEFSNTCLEEIEQICYYIDKTLKAKKASSKLRKKIYEKIKYLKIYPRMYAKVERKNNRMEKYRKIVIDNFIILYTIKKENIILISHMYYSRKNYLEGGRLYNK